MNILKVLIVDDDISFVTELRMNLEQFNDLSTRSESTEGGAITAIIEFEPDLVICDINLNGHKSGIVISEFLSSRFIPFVVVTQYKDDAIYNSMVEYEPIAYFTKPLDFVSLKYTITTLLKDKSIGTSNEDMISDPVKSFVFLRKKSKYDKVDFSDIYFVRAEGNYVTFYCTNQKYVVRSSLRKCMERISPDFFIQINRNHLINFHWVKSINLEDNSVLIGLEQLPIGRSYKSELLGKLPLF